MELSIILYKFILYHFIFQYVRIVLKGDLVKKNYFFLCNSGKLKISAFLPAVKNNLSEIWIISHTYFYVSFQIAVICHKFFFIEREVLLILLVNVIIFVPNVLLFKGTKQEKRKIPPKRRENLKNFSLRTKKCRKFNLLKMNL